MNLKIVITLFIIYCSRVESATLWDQPYNYFLSLSKNVAPSLMSIFECMRENEAWSCAREKAGKLLDGWEAEVDNERKSWQAEADAEVVQSGRSLEEMPSKIGDEVEKTLASLTEVVHIGMSRALRKHDSGVGITISTGEKKKMKKQKPKPHIHLIHPMVMPMNKHHDKGRSFPNGRQSWVIGDKIDSNVDGVLDRGVSDGVVLDRIVSNGGLLDGGMSKSMAISDKGMGEGREMSESRGIMSDLWSIGNDALDAVAEHAMESENKDNGIEDKSSFAEQRGKKKKKKKAILKLLILGAVLKAKIGTLLQILSFKLQVKFFIVAVLGLAINLARLWIDLKKKHSEQPQKVIYYEHAQHQHHYDHEEEHDHGWGPWSRSMDPNEETDIEVDVDLHNSPYRGQERIQYSRPILN